MIERSLEDRPWTPRELDHVSRLKIALPDLRALATGQRSVAF